MATKLDKEQVVKMLLDLVRHARIEWAAGRLDRSQYLIIWEGFQMAANLIEQMGGGEA